MLVVLGTAAVLIAVISLRGSVRRRREARRLVDPARRALHEDVAALDSDLEAFERDHPGPRHETAIDLGTARERAEVARSLLASFTGYADVPPLLDAVVDARYALDCARSREMGSALPSRRVLCHVDPRHGTATADDVLWTRGGHGTKRVAVCSADAARLRDGLPLTPRRVRLEDADQDYWDVLTPPAPGARGAGKGHWGLTPVSSEDIGGVLPNANDQFKKGSP
jgi:hypothetical protein